MDDDFGDFGGFEAAEIVESNVAQPLSETLPWVKFQASTSNPDLLSQLQSIQVIKENILEISSQSDTISTLKKTSEVYLHSTPSDIINEEKQDLYEECERKLSSSDLEVKEIFSDCISLEKELPPAYNNNPVTLDNYLVSSKHFQESDRIQQDLETLQRKSLEEELKKTKASLEEQQQRVVSLMAQHECDLEQLRTAGHDALALITKEYKEHCKVAILEQKEVCEKQLQEALSKQTQQCYNLMEEQHHRLLKSFESMTENSQQETKEVLEKQRIEQTRLLEQAFAEEKEKSREALQILLEEEKSKSQVNTELVLQMERNKTRQYLDEEKKKMKEAISEEQMKCEMAIQKALENERQISRELITKNQGEEELRSQKAIETALEFSKKDFKIYLQEQRELDHGTNRRYLASLDLFLESARHQLQMLMTNQDKENQTKPSNDLPLSL